MLTTDLQEHWNNGFFGVFFFLKCFNNPHQKLDSVNLMGLIVCVGQPFGIYAYALSGEELDVKIQPIRIVLVSHRGRASCFPWFPVLVLS